MPKRPSSAGPSARRKRLRRNDRDDEPRTHPLSDDPQADPEDVILPNEPPAPALPDVSQSDVAAAPSDDEEEGAASDASAMSEDDEPEEDLAASIQLSKLRGFAHSGILAFVEVHRFMCHECFRYDLGPNVNIINGNNGSGKSAIVAALQIGLGASANATERASKLEDHIMHKKDSAIIRIKVRNRRPPPADDSVAEPDLTYKHDVYGDGIIIERRLGRGGRGAGFSIKDGDDKKVKLPEGVSPRQEINNIIDHFGFMVTNPVAILTQTKAKQFLAGKKPTDHYNLFREATLLAPLESELQQTEDVTFDVKKRIDHSEENLPKTKRDLEKLEAAHNEAQSMKNIDQQITETRVRWAWTLVLEGERTSHHHQDLIHNSFIPSKEAAETAVQKSEQKIKSLEDQSNRDKQVLDEATQRSRLADRNLKTAQTEKKRLDFELGRHKRNVQICGTEARNAEDSIQATRAKMKEAEERHFAGQDQKNRIFQQIQELRETEDDLQAQVVAHKQQYSLLSDQEMKLDDEVRQLQADTERIRTHHEEKIGEQRRAIQAANGRNSLGRFGRNVCMLDKVIQENHRRFERMPLGPIGQFINLDDQTWAPAIETALGFRTLCTFIVHSSRDARVLKDLFDREKATLHPSERRRVRMPAVFVSNLDIARYAIGQDMVPDMRAEGHKTILETLAIQNDAVHNALVDQNQIERVVLNGNEGEDITVLGWSRRPNLFMVWNKSCERAYTRNGSNTFRRAPFSNPIARFLTKDMRRYLESLQQDVDSLSEKLKNNESRLHSAHSDARAVKSQVLDLKRDIHQAQQGINNTAGRRAPLEDQLNQAQNPFDPTPFENDISGYERSKKEYEAQQQSARAEVADIESKISSFNSEIATAKAAHARVRREAERLVKDSEALQRDLAKMKSRHRHVLRDLEAAARKLTQANEEHQAHQADVLKNTEQARQMGECPRDIDIDKVPSEKVKRHLELLKQKLLAEQQRRGGLSAEAIEEEYLKAAKKYREHLQLQRRIMSYEKALTKGIRSRKIKLRDLKKSIRAIVRSNFRMFLGMKGHTGNIRFSKNANGEGELHLSTMMKNHILETGERHETKELSSLSGGEKSLTTMAFMLSMAEICQNPVRVFDEIDVYQDDATRRTTYKMLIDFCTKYLSNRQIVLITPCRLPGVRSTDSVKVVRMEDPRPDTSGMRQMRIHEFTGADDEE